MAVMHRLVHRPPSDVWDVLSDGDRYAAWVVGTHDSWEKDPQWPREGAALGYRLKLGPWSYEGTTVVRICEPQRRLELEAMAGKAGSARIAIELRPWGKDTLVVIDEHPLRGRNGSVHSAAIDAFVHLRHRGVLRRLARVAESEGRGSRVDA
ncbi:SRPBCC family protein [Streptomyces sp. ISL-94]|uniref:SRPBCC family protein n=1 Tax=Streptomyces sp. ISL-94 TaxID=2819190 RepID=UPI001BE9B411|nr:SRPBCC family protein [Streptomyces sp. ISL-94]MBT2479750.1 SRPBCC family protein [Streptomyces sp. ISL-94]